MPRSAVSAPATTPAVDDPAPRVGAAFAGLAVALPKTVVTNAPIAERIGVDHDWITSRTGIHERRRLLPEEPLAGLAATAATAALADAGMTPADVDLLLLATATPDDLIPNTAPDVAGRLGIGGGAIDVGAACTGFLTSVQLAAAQLESGRMDTVLVVGAEKLSAFTDPDDKRTAAIFGDAAGAAVLTRTAGPGEVGPIRMYSEAQRDLLFAGRERGLIEMQGYDVFQHAVNKMSAATREVVERAGLTLADIDLFVYHQANARIIRSVGQRLGLDSGKVVDCIARHGNVSAASLPVALASARADGRLTDGAKVLMAAFGAGFVWGAGIIDWRASA